MLVMEACRMKLSVLDNHFSVVRLAPGTPIPEWSCQQTELFSITATPEEVSIVCPTNNIPEKLQDMVVDHDWRCLKVEGVLNFYLTGILSSLATPLAHHGIAIFAISTFNTDYILVQEESLEETIRVLEEAGNQFIPC